LKFVSLQNAEFLVMNTSENQNAIFPRGERAPADYFTGKVWVKPLVPDDQVFNCVIGNVIFEPGARNNWHKHPGGQILIVSHGIGYYQEKGKPIQLLHKGDVVKIPPETIHWHGASPDSEFTHIAISTNTQNGVVEWLDRVTDEEYKI
jgi:quercetin dioxygenase-like cupin family protein